jgi:hypothetical protein
METGAIVVEQPVVGTADTFPTDPNTNHQLQFFTSAEISQIERRNETRFKGAADKKGTLDDFN